MIHGITFTDANMTISAELCKSSMEQMGVDSCEIKTPSDIDPVFERFNHDILSQPRGVGYWLWKPYFIYRTMLDMQEGDYLIYSDAGVEFISSVHPIIEAMGDQPIFLFSNRWPHVEWCKGDAFKVLHSDALKGAMNDYPGLEKRAQVQASNIFIQVSQAAKDLVKEWLLWCQFPGLIDDSPSVTDNFPTLAEHRHDQAILACLAIKYGIPLHWFPATTNIDRIEQGDHYPALFNYHRRRDNEWT